MEEDRFERRWTLWKRLHALSSPGAVREIRWKCSLTNISHFRMGKDKFHAVVIGLLGLGSLVRGTKKVEPVVEELFFTMELLGVDDNKVDIRELVGALLILEFEQEFKLSCEKYLELLFEVFDTRCRNWLGRSDIKRMLLVTAFSIDVARTLHYIGRLPCEGSTRVGLKEVLALPALYLDFICDSIFHSLDDERRLSYDFKRESHLNTNCLRRANLIFLQTYAKRMLLRKIETAFLAWVEYTIEYRESRLLSGFAQGYFRGRALNLTFTKLKWWRDARQWNYKAFVKASLHYRRSLLFRCMCRFQACHAFYAVRRALAKTQDHSIKLKAAELLFAVLKKVEKRAVEEAYLLWKRIHKQLMQAITVAIQFNNKKVTRKIFQGWKKTTEQSLRIKKIERDKRESQALMHELFKSMHEEAQENEEKKKKMQLNELTEKRRQKKYLDLHIRKKEGKLELKMRDRDRLLQQALLRRDRVRAQRETNAMKVEQHRGLVMQMIEIEARDHGELESTKKEMDSSAKRILKLLKKNSKKRLTADQATLVRLYDGNIDRRRFGASLECMKEEISRTLAENVKKGEPNIQHTGDESKREGEVDGDWSDGWEEDTEEEKLEYFEEEEICLDSLAVRKVSPSKVVLVLRKNLNSRTNLKKTDRTVQRLVDSLIKWQVIERKYFELLDLVEEEVCSFQKDLRQYTAASAIQEGWRSRKRHQALLAQLQDAKSNREYRCAILIQRFWRGRIGREESLQKMEKVWYWHMDPYTQRVFFINADSGWWRESAPLVTRGKPGAMRRINRPRRWVTLYDEDQRIFFYRDNETEFTTTSFPMGFEICCSCQVDFASRGCLQCRWVENGEVHFPYYCIPCWVHGQAHCRHEYEELQILFLNRTVSSITD